MGEPLVAVDDVDFTSSDLWALQTFLKCSSDKRSAALYDLISVGDGINHAIFLPGELQSALDKFLRLEYIKVDENGMSLSEVGRSTFEGVTKKKLSLSKEQEALRRITKAKEWKPKQKFPEYNEGLDPIFFGLSDYDEAVRRYQKDANRVIARILKGKT